MSKGALNFNEQKVEYYTPKSLIDFFFTPKRPCEYDPATIPEGRIKFETNPSGGGGYRVPSLWVSDCPPDQLAQHGIYPQGVA